MKLTRRDFFKKSAAAAAAVVVAPKLFAEEVAKIINVDVEHGFTWFIKDKSVFPNNDFQKIVTETLRKRHKLLAENVSRGNPLVLRLQNRDFRLNVEKISEEEQERRITERTLAKLADRDKRYTSSLAGRDEMLQKVRSKDTSGFYYIGGYENVCSK